jgi:hypothetical protein
MKKIVFLKRLILCSLILVLVLSSISFTPDAQAKGENSSEKSYAAISDTLGNLAYKKSAIASNVVPIQNLAYMKPVTADNYHSPAYSGEKAVDGDQGTRWATTDNTESAALVVDFGENTTFDKVVFTQLSQRIGSYIIQYWNGTNWINAYNGNRPGSKGDLTFDPVTGSKVRFYITSTINGPGGPSIWEFSVFNTKSNSATPDPMYDGTKAVDASPDTRWATEDHIKSATLDIDFEENITFDKIEFTQLEKRISDYQIQYWNGSYWNNIYTREKAESKESITFKPVTGSKVKLIINSSTGGPSIKEFQVINTNASKGLSRGSRVLIEKGLQQQAWITTDETERHYPTAEEWNGIHFTTATYYEDPLFNDQFHKIVPNTQWSIAKAPYAEHLFDGPKSVDHFLNEKQRANLNNLVQMGFGDEESFGTENVSYLRDWFDLSKTLYPSVLVHNNQWAGQWSQDQLRSYVRSAKPDLLTFDSYYFSENYNYPGGSIRSLYDSLSYYRTIALEGYDGTGKSPLPFGQYTLGYKTGGSPADVGSYVVSESEINIVSFATWAMGGKWTNLFRWEKDPEVFLFYDEEGNLTPQYYQYAEMAKQGNNLGDHLVRLNSKDVRIIPGEHLSNNEVVTNRKPDSISLWDKSADQYIQSIDVENSGNVNDGLKGDVLIGYFETLPDLPKEELKKLPSKSAKYFMIMNGLTAKGEEGSSENTRQNITLHLDVKGEGPNSLWKVDKNTGKVERVELTHVKGHQYKADITLGGGKADLFFWK